MRLAKHSAHVLFGYLHNETQGQAGVEVWRGIALGVLGLTWHAGKFRTRIRRVHLHTERVVSRAQLLVSTAEEGMQVHRLQNNGHLNPREQF